MAWWWRYLTYSYSFLNALNNFKACLINDRNVFCYISSIFSPILLWLNLRHKMSTVLDILFINIANTMWPITAKFIYSRCCQVHYLNYQNTNRRPAYNMRRLNCVRNYRKPEIVPQIGERIKKEKEEISWPLCGEKKTITERFYEPPYISDKLWRATTKKRYR